MRKSKITNTLKISLSIIMVVVICIVTMGSVPTKIYTAYIDPQLKEVLSAATATDLIPVDIWLYEIDTNKVEEKVLEKTGFSKASLANEKTAAEVTHAEVDAYIETERAVYAEAQTEQSEAFLNKHSKVFGSRTSAGGNLLFVSRYAPVIQAELTPAQIATMAKDLSVSGIYYSPDLEAIPVSNVADNVTEAGFTRDYSGLTGTGIKIGILEYGGLPERGSYNIPLNKIAFDPNVNKTVFSAHASHVASILMGSEYITNGITYYGIVPDAMFYATYFDNNNMNWRERVEWLIGKGVNVINMSFSLYYNGQYSGEYEDFDLWLEHVAIEHSVHIVSASGNLDNKPESNTNPYNYVCSPGLAYNVITVGNLNDKNTVSLLDDEIATDSSYIENNNSISLKPDLVAPGTNISTPVTTDSGTSYAAPQVAGIVAQLCQSFPTLKTKQAAMKAILTASIDHPIHNYKPSDSAYNVYGAGCVNAEEALATANYRYVNSNFSATAPVGTYERYYLTASPDDSKFRISLSWLKNVCVVGTDHTNSYPPSNIGVADLDLRIYNSLGTLIYQSNQNRGNVEIVEIDSVVSGEIYVIEVYLKTSASTTTYYSVAWW